MISLAFISAEYAKEGTELEILWGTPGTRQMKVRAKVARFPYNQDYIRNEKRDVSDIPVLKDETGDDYIGKIKFMCSPAEFSSFAGDLRDCEKKSVNKILL